MLRWKLVNIITSVAKLRELHNCRAVNVVNLYCETWPIRKIQTHSEGS